MKHRTKKMLSILLILVMVAGLFPAMSPPARAAETDSDAVTVKQGGDDSTFAADAPIATVRLNPDKFNMKNVNADWNDLDYDNIRFEQSGVVWTTEIMLNQTEDENKSTKLGDFKLTFSKAAILPDGTEKDVEVVFKNVTAIGRKDGSQYEDEVSVARITGNPNQPIAFSPFTTEENHIGLKAEITFCVKDVGDGDVFLFDARHINVNRSGNSNFTYIVGADANFNYSESMEPVSGVVAGSHLYLPADSALRVETGSSSPTLGHRFVGSGTQNNGFNHGFAAAAQAKNGFQSWVWSSAGKVQNPVEILFLGGGLTHPLTVSSGDGGTADLWSDGTVDSIAATKLPGGTLVMPLTYDVPNGKQVTVKMTPQSGNELDMLYVNNDKVEATPVADSTGKVTHYTYTFPADATGAQALAVTWKSLPSIDASVWWKYDGETKTLHISGEEKAGYEHFHEDLQAKVGAGEPIPWMDHQEKIEIAVIEGKPAPVSTLWWFYGMSKLKEIQNIVALDTSNVTNMSGMFYDCASLTALDVSGFNTSKVTDMSNMFCDCASLAALDVSGFDMSKVSDVSYMFNGCPSLVTIYAAPGTDWWRKQEEGSSAKWSNHDDMFNGCSSLAGGSGMGYETFHGSARGARVDGGAADPGYFTAAYTVTLLPTENGTASVSPDKGGVNAKITVTAMPAENYELDSMSYTRDDGTDTVVPITTSGNTGTFLMPDCNVTVKVTFREKGYNLWLGSTRVTISNANDILGNGTARYDPNTGTLTLNSPRITTLSPEEMENAVIFCDAKGPLTIVGAADLDVPGAQYGIRYQGEGDLTVNGNISASGVQGGIYAPYANVNITGGKVTATATFTGSPMAPGGGTALYTEKKLTLSGGELTAEAPNGGSNIGISAAEGVDLLAGSATVQGKQFGISTGGNITVENGVARLLAVGGSSPLFPGGRIILGDKHTFRLPDWDAWHPHAAARLSEDGKSVLKENGENAGVALISSVYTVTFNAKGGTFNGLDTCTATTDSEGMLSSLPVPTHSGSYKFDGWYTEETGGTKVDETTRFTTDTILYAHWTQTGGGGRPSYPVTPRQPGEGGTVTTNPTNASPGTEVTVTPQPEEGYEVDTVKVTDENGKEIPVTKNDDGTFTFTMPKGAVNVTATFKETAHDCPSAKFTDVDRSAWYHEYVDYVVSKGLMKGVSADKFAPGMTTTRAMIVTMLYRLEMEDGSGKNTIESPSSVSFADTFPPGGRLVSDSGMQSSVSFEDVEPGSWYEEAVKWAAEKGIVKGYSETKFGPTDEITREQFAAILYRYEQYKGGGFTGDWMFDLDFADAADVSDWADEAMHWCVMKGIFEGDENGKLRPRGKATRAEAAAILMRFIENGN